MKLALIRGLLILSLAFAAGDSIAQPPPFINWQSVAKDSYNNVAKYRDIYVKISVYQKAPVGGKLVWEESFVTKSNEDGVYTITIGKGTKGGVTINDISEIDWANGPFFQNTKVAVSPSIPASWWVAADNYVDMGTFQWASVPYAMFAGNATVTNVNTSIQPGPRNTFLITDSLGNVNWQVPQAAQQNVTYVTNLNLTVSSGQNVVVDPNTTAVVSITVPGVRRGDPIIVTPQDDYVKWQVYSSWVSADDTINIRFANYTVDQVTIFGSQYKIVVIK